MEKTITVNTEKMVWRDGMTVDDILKERRYVFKLLVIKINGTVVKKDQWKTCKVPENADVQVLHLMSGG